MITTEKMNELIENYGDDAIIAFEKEFGNFVTEYYEDYLEARKASAYYGEDKIDIIIKEFVKNFGWEDLDHLEESFCGFHNSFTSFAADFFDDLYLHEIPKHLQNYIDYEKFANDLRYDGYFWVEEHGMVFNNNW
jgi:hypothetical protein